MKNCSEHQERITPQPMPTDGQLKATGKLLSVASHPVRLLVLFALGRQGSLSAGELQQLAQIEQSAMSHQLAILRKARLIIACRRGKHSMYSLADHHVLHILEDALSHVCEPEQQRDTDRECNEQ